MRTVMIAGREIAVATVNGIPMVGTTTLDQMYGVRKGTYSSRFYVKKGEFTKNDFQMVVPSETKGVEMLIKRNASTPRVMLCYDGFMKMNKMYAGDPVITKEIEEKYFGVDNSEPEPIAPKEPAMGEVVTMLAKVLTNQNKILEALISRLEEKSTVTATMATTTAPVSTHKTIIMHKKETPKDEDYQAWKKDIESLLVGYDAKEVLHETYKYMRNVYGIVWEDERTKFHRQFERFASTLELCYWLEKKPGYENLFINSLAKVSENFTRETKRILYPVTTTKGIKDLAIYIAAQTGNRLYNGAGILKPFFGRLTRERNIDWDKAAEIYAKRTGKPARSASKLDIVGCTPETTKICVDAFNKYVSEKYPVLIKEVSE